ncbi:MAG: hypothetical protein ISS47_01630 [Candidatus Omnitrophica bacterium]|nr:hypothetical protein [Candidatus Omnitrophota bacterium]
MNVLPLFISAIIAVGLLILHSYLFRGARITFNFFFFAFLCALRKERILLTPAPRCPYEYLNCNLPVFWSILAATVGWLFAFYIGWTLAEMIFKKRIVLFEERIFPTLLLTSLIIGSIAYCLEATGIAMGWWKWRFIDLRQANFLIGCPFMAIEAWFFFSVYFLAAYFLIECSRFRRVNWKCIFFLLPLIFLWYFQFISPKLSQKIAIAILFPLSFLSPLKFEYGQAEWPESVKFSLNIRRLLTDIPLFMILFMLGFVIVMDLAVIKQPALLVSALPAFFFLLLCIKKIPFYFILILAVVLFAVIGSKFVPSLIPVGFVMIFWISGKVSNKKEKAI